MDDQRWNRIKSIFDEIIQTPHAEREAVFQLHCAGEPTLRQAIESLVVSFEADDSFLAHPVVENLSPSLFGLEETGPGQKISHYQILQKLGQGGMGTVWLAERTGEYRQQVALKIMRPGLGLEFVTRRFQLERQILATLDHPNIARLIDGGTTNAGFPFLVMEFVGGVPLDQFCTEKRLGLRERLELFRKICAAVQYAHQNLVIHRDLKPGNILVTEEGIPKLLDFGIAKLLGLHPHIEMADQTQTALRLLTPRYASPEQIRGSMVTTATDVYSLGVVLYEILTGQFPYPVVSLQPTELERAICETEPARPSTVIKKTAIETSGATTWPVSAKSLAGDLDTILLKALQKDPTRRYSSVEQFSQDLSRYLAGLPVLAQPDRFWYRAHKFIGRNKTGALAASLVFLALVAGIGTTTWQARLARQEKARAERRFNDVRKLANSFLTELSPMFTAPETRDARRLLIQKTMEYLDSIAVEAQDDAALQRELAYAYYVVGDNQGNPYTANLGDTAGALRNYQKALAIAERLAAADPENLDVRYTLATCYTNIGEVLQVTGDIAGAKAYYQKGMPLHESVALNRTMPDTRNEWMVANCRWGNLLVANGENRSALEAYRRAVKIGEWLVRLKPQDANIQRLSRGMKMRLAEQSLAFGNPVEAVTSLEQSLAQLDRLYLENPKDPALPGNIGLVCQVLGLAYLWSGRVEESISIYQRTLSLSALAMADDPKNIQGKNDHIAALNNLALAWAGVGRYEHALREIRKGAHEAHQLAMSAPDNYRLQQNFASIIASEVEIEMQAGVPLVASDSILTSIRIYQTILAKDTNNAVLKLDAGSSFIVLGKALAQLGDVKQAEILTQQAQTMLRELAERPEALVTDRQKYAEALISCQPVELRNPELGVLFAEQAATQSSYENHMVLKTLVEGYEQIGKKEKALEIAQHNLPIQRVFRQDQSRKYPPDR